jgi:choline dehydrogenase
VVQKRAAGMYLLLAKKATGRIDLRTNARASQIIFERQRAVGVRYIDERDRSLVRKVLARREVIICGGTIDTPRLLQISGVGPADLLRELGSPVVHELAGVGANFRDHFSVRVVARAKKGTETMNELTRGPKLVAQ